MKKLLFFISLSLAGTTMFANDPASRDAKYGGCTLRKQPLTLQAADVKVSPANTVLVYAYYTIIAGVKINACTVSGLVEGQIQVLNESNNVIHYFDLPCPSGYKSLQFFIPDVLSVRFVAKVANVLIEGPVHVVTAADISSGVIELTLL